MIHELTHDLNGYRVFSNLNHSQGYHQIELHPDSRYITTFSSHSGLHRCKHLNFGLKAASEKFQQIMQFEQVLEGLEGVKNISDDIVIGSADVEQYQRHLRGLTLNKSNCEFF